MYPQNPTCPGPFSSRPNRRGSPVARTPWVYEKLPPEDKILISRWFIRAWEEYSCKPDESFEPFINTWIAFNSWGSSVTGEDVDRRVNITLAADTRLSKCFADLLNSDPAFASDAQTFHSYWPIFKTQELNLDSISLNAAPPLPLGRQPIIHFYLTRLTTQFPNIADRSLRYSPGCWERHPAGPPLDWPHTLAAIYTVRCNLFHGEKQRDNENDCNIVYYAFRVLVRFIRSFPSQWGFSQT